VGSSLRQEDEAFLDANLKYRYRALQFAYNAPLAAIEAAPALRLILAAGPDIRGAFAVNVEWLRPPFDDFPIDDDLFDRFKTREIIHWI